MGKVLSFQKPKQIDYLVVEERELEAKEVRIETIYSGISTGTQLTLYRGTAPTITKKWNSEMKLFENQSEEHTAYPVPGGWAYEEVGRVMEVGSEVDSINLGDIIYGAWGHRTHHIVSEQFATNHKLMKGLDPLAGIYAQMGSIALNAILDANIHVGETVLIFGQGVPGQIATQLAKLNGATVIAVDLNDQRLDWSKRSGADITLHAGKLDVAKKVRELTDGLGADVSIEFSGALPALHEAIRSTAYNGNVVCSGFYQGAANHLFLGEEFHHNRVKMISSQISGVAPEISHRWNRLRMEKTIMNLQLEKKLQLTDLVTHIIPFEEAPKAYDMLDKQSEDSLQVVLKF